MSRANAFVASPMLAPPVLAHRGGGTFDNTRTIELKGSLTRLSS